MGKIHPQKVQKTISNRVKNLMASQNEQEADIVNIITPILKISYSNAMGRLCHYLKNEARWSMDYILIIANYYDVSIDWLVGRDDKINFEPTKIVEENKKLRKFIDKMKAEFNEFSLKK